MITLYISPNGSYVSSEDSEADFHDFFAQHDDVHRVEIPDDTEEDIEELVAKFVENLHR